MYTSKIEVQLLDENVIKRHWYDSTCMGEQKQFPASRITESDKYPW